MTTTTQMPGRTDAPTPTTTAARGATSPAPAGRLTRPRQRSLSARIRASVSRALTRMSDRLTAGERADAARDAAAVLAALAPVLAATLTASPADDTETCEVCPAPAETVVLVDGVPVVVCRVCAVLPAGVLAERTRQAAPATRRGRRDLWLVA